MNPLEYFLPKTGPFEKTPQRPYGTFGNTTNRERNTFAIVPSY